MYNCNIPVSNKPKPSFVLGYSALKSFADQANQQILPYAWPHRSLRWTIAGFQAMLRIGIWNSYILWTNLKQENIAVTYRQYLLQLAKGLVSQGPLRIRRSSEMVAGDPLGQGKDRHHRDRHHICFGDDPSIETIGFPKGTMGRCNVCNGKSVRTACYGCSGRGFAYWIHESCYHSHGCCEYPKQ